MRLDDGLEVYGGNGSKQILQLRPSERCLFKADGRRQVCVAGQNTVWAPVVIQFANLVPMYIH